MSYNPTQAGIDDVRILTGNILPDDYPDTQIAKKLSSAYSTIQMVARRGLTDPFLITDVEYEFSRELQLKIAARDALKAYGPEFDTKVKELDAEIKEGLQFLQDNLQAGAGGTGQQVEEALSIHLLLRHIQEPDAPIYRSIKDGAGSTVHPWTLE